MALMGKNGGISSIRVVADRGMISRETVEQLQSPERKVHFILVDGRGDLSECKESA